MTKWLLMSLMIGQCIISINELKSQQNA